MDRRLRENHQLVQIKDRGALQKHRGLVHPHGVREYSPYWIVLLSVLLSALSVPVLL